MKVENKNEIWKAVEGFEDLYDVSNFGRVRRKRYTNRHIDIKIQPKLLKLTKTKLGYIRTTLSKKGMPSGFFVHVLVLKTFVGQAPQGCECAHMDGTRDNNHIDNLKWTTRKENHAHKKIHGTSQHGQNNPFAKLTEKDVLKIRELRSKGKTLKEVSSIFNVSMRNISIITNRGSWTHI